MNKNAFTVISLGNYETKFFCCYVNSKKEIMPIYASSFITKDYFENSLIIDEDLFKKNLLEEIRKIPLNINLTQIILNIPIKELNIVNFTSNEYLINSEFTNEMWKKIENENNIKFSMDNYVKLDSKSYLWIVDGKEYFSPPIGKDIKRLSYKAKIFYISKNFLDNYLKIFNEINIKVHSVVADSLVLQCFFEKPERRFKLLLNIGHIDSTFELFDNMVLAHQFKVNLGIKALTSKICEATGINEAESIELLKVYKDLVLIDKEMALVNHFKEKFFEYKQVKVQDINVFIISWLKKLINLINNHIKLLFSLNYDVDEIYIYSSTNIFNTWINYIQPKLIKFTEVKIIKFDVIGIEESKYFSLIGSILSFIESDINFNLNN